MVYYSALVLTLTLTLTLILNIQEFDLNEAHCYSPNEEYKLRQIFYSMGQERVNEIKVVSFYVM